MLDRHGVDYVLVGGRGARAHRATRPPSDIDLVPDGDVDNLTRSAAVHVAALSDIIASKEHADREKDREALPELRALDREH